MLCQTGVLFLGHPVYRRPLCLSTGDIRLYKLKKYPLLTNKMSDVFSAPSDRIIFFVNDTSSVGSFVNVKNGATCQLEVKALLF